jgi:cytochrome b6-f complex iron-sulfur subunit|tara:strand:- start:106 stop:735 length:630 start_codon:yes stop_codon:yes gene_type:complete
MTEKINNTCECDCLNQQPKNPSRRDFIKKASTLTIIGSTAFILEACGGGGSPTSSGGDTDGGGDTGGGDTGGGDTGGGNNGGGTGDTGYNYDSSTGIITINITMIHQTLQTVGNGIQLSGSNTFDNNGIIVLRTSNSGVRALSRNCTHAGSTVNFDSINNNLPCSLQGGSHGSVFDINGNVVRGPANRSLTRYTASINAEGTIITISQS